MGLGSFCKSGFGFALRCGVGCCEFRKLLDREENVVVIGMVGYKRIWCAAAPRDSFV